MPEGAEAPLSAEDAARALADLPRYEEGLTGMAFAVTLMAYGIASAAIGLTYEASEAWVLANDVPWAFAFLWAPWILAATLLTTIVWHAQSIRLQSNDAHGAGRHTSWLYALAFSGLYIGLVFAEQAMAARTSWNPAGPIANLYVLAVFTGAIATVFHFRHGGSRFISPVYGGAAFALAMAIVGDSLGLTSVPAMWWAAAATLAAYVGAGFVIARRA